MYRNDCLDERLVDVACGIAFLLLALLLVVIGVTFLPVIGLILATPAYFLSLSFFRAPPGRGCARP